MVGEIIFLAGGHERELGKLPRLGAHQSQQVLGDIQEYLVIGIFAGFQHAVDRLQAAGEAGQDFVADGGRGIGQLVDGLPGTKGVKFVGDGGEVGYIDREQVHRDAADARARPVTLTTERAV